MLKKILGTLTLFLTINACAETPPTLSDLAVNKETKALFKEMTKAQKLPKWVLQGGTDGETHSIYLKGNDYQISSSCKPKQCGLEQIAVLYSPTARIMAGVLAKNTEHETQQKLIWLNVPDSLSIDGKTVLYATLTGAIDNHPNWFGKSESASPSLTPTP
jgi:hypothetical protein